MANATRDASGLRVAIMAGILVSALLLGVTPVSSSAPHGAPDKVDADLRAKIAAMGAATFWIDLRERADLSAVTDLRDWDARGAAVMNVLRTTADRSQADIRSLLAARGASFSAYWISNAIRVTGGASLLAELAARPDVERLRADRTYPLLPVTAGTPIARVDTVEWGIARIRADDVWTDFGVRGEGIVVANIDTGVQFRHPALKRQYRGKLPGGGYDHHYDWWDPSQICTNPRPCDNNGHGTHTMGTLVGDDGAGNQIGVAPRAKWITAKGCESTGCSAEALLSSGQFMLAPTRLDGSDPRPGKRPHVINNSWGGAPGDSWFRDTVQAWVAAGIFTQFPVGSSGPGCGTTGSPGDYPESYATGAFDMNDTITSFSSRGPSSFGGETKPDIAAPGVSVRSSWNNGGYQILTGTSMASPHVAGTVALLWSAHPSLRRDIAATRTLLDDGAIDTAGTCGGTVDNNNTYGEGRLDAYASVELGTG